MGDPANSASADDDDSRDSVENVPDASQRPSPFPQTLSYSSAPHQYASYPSTPYTDTPPGVYSPQVSSYQNFPPHQFPQSPPLPMAQYYYPQYHQSASYAPHYQYTSDEQSRAQVQDASLTYHHDPRQPAPALSFAHSMTPPGTSANSLSPYTMRMAYSSSSPLSGYMPPSMPSASSQSSPYPGTYRPQPQRSDSHGENWSNVNRQMSPSYAAYDPYRSGGFPSGPFEGRSVPRSSSRASPAFPGSPTNPSPTVRSPSESSRSPRAGSEGQGQASSINWRSFQPKPPANRSEWVMWVGNIPTDCTEVELMRFFELVSNERQEGQAVESDQGTSSGVISIRLISQSNCAFVNFESEARLLHAVNACNGRPLRPDDPRCLKLVCRVRKRDEDARAGVGAQRGARMHIQWVQDRKNRGLLPVTGPPHSEIPHRSMPITGTPSSSSTGPSTPSVMPEPAKTSPTFLRHDGSPGEISLASTNSSFLAQYFPQRYFILKSLTQQELLLSVQRKLWATQPHNEFILDQAFRTSKDVFLIFSANKSGEFFGYARMSGPISTEDSRPDPRNSSAHSSARPIGSDFEQGDVDLSAQLPTPSEVVGQFLSPAEPSALRESPIPFTPGSTKSVTDPPHAATAPAEMDRPFRRISKAEGPAHADTFEDKRSPPLTLDPEAPYRAMRTSSARTGSAPADVAGESRLQDATEALGALSVREPPPTGMAGPQNDVDQPNWGSPFPIEWVRVQPLSFNKTKNIRNPWNSDKEVKVSRDGTELEPDVGQQLLAEWDELPIPSVANPSRGRNRQAGGRK